MKTPDLSTYADWLSTAGYQSSTIQVSLRHMRNLAAEPFPVLAHQKPHVRRYLRFVKITGQNPMGRQFASEMRDAGYKPSGDIRKAGKRVKKTLGSAQWGKLRAHLRRGDETSLLLVAYMHSGYRISEFLNLWVRGLDGDEISDKLSLDWIEQVFSSPKNKRLYMILCDTQRCAYYRLRRKLQEASESTDINVDLDTLYKSYHELYGEEAA